MKLPRSLDDLTGRRAARWIRESTRGQFDNFGPDAQRDQQDRTIERHGLIDTGIAWQVAHSGRTIAKAPAFAEMLARAGRDFDVLVVGYVSRFTRDLRTAVNARHDLHNAGAVLLFCDERVLSSDESAWEAWAREAVEAEAYSRRLGRNIASGYEAKFRRHADQGGNPPLGFRRVNGLLEVDPDARKTVVEIFQSYASGTVSLTDLAASTGLHRDALRMMVANPIYNGWVRRHRRSRDEQLLPAAWRSDPPIDDELWLRVQEVRRRRHNGGGAPTPRHAHLLNGLLFCSCGRRITAEMHQSGRRYRHHDGCDAWATSTVKADRFDEPISAQVRGTRLTARWIAQLRRLASIDRPRPAPLRRRQLERELVEKATLHARGRLSTAAYLAEHSRIAAQMEAATEPEQPLVDPEKAVRWLSDLRRAWDLADVAARHGLIAAIYERITVTPDGFVEAELTPAAYAHGLALAMPEKVLGARPAGFKQSPDTRAVAIPIVARREWLRLLRTA